MMSVFVMSAPSVVVTNPSSQISGQTLAIGFTITGEDYDVNNPDDLIIAYGTTAGAFTNTIYTDTNLIDGTGVTCDDYNFYDATTCSYSWVVPQLTPRSYYIDANYIQHETGTGYTDSTTAFRVENTQGCSTLNLGVLLIALGLCFFALMRLLADTNINNMVVFAVSVIIALVIIYTFTAGVCVVT